MKKENIIGIVIAVASIFLLLLLLFIWLLTRPKQTSISTYGPTPTLSAAQKAKQTPVNTSTSSLLNNGITGLNNGQTSSINESSGINKDASSQSPAFISVLGNQYGNKNYSEYLSPELKKKEAEIQSNLRQTLSPVTNTASQTQTSPLSQEGSKQLNLLLKLFNTFMTAPDLSNTTDSTVFSTLPIITPTPPLVNSQPAPLSPGLLSGKIGIYILSDYSLGAKQIVASKPRIIKVMDPQSNNTIDAIKDYKGMNPQGITVLRAYIGTSGTKFTLQDDPIAAAQSFFQIVVSPALSSLGENIKLFDFIETPNELDNTPGWESTANTTWLNSFWIRLMELYSGAGLRTCIASIPVGNPPGDYAQIKGELTPFLPALQKVKELGGAFCYHAYTLNYSTDVNQEIQTSLRYRQIHQVISELDNSLSSLPFILSEAGVDQNGNPKTSGWAARGSEGDYKNWLSWFNGQINQDSYVLGATLYQIGDNHWSSFNIESIADWISKSL